MTTPVPETPVTPPGWRERLAMRVLENLGAGSQQVDSIRAILGAIVEETGIQCAGFRLREGEDFPFQVVHGFSREFADLEHGLHEREPDGAILRDERGRPILACLCGAVLTRKSDCAPGLFTPNGSFYAGNLGRQDAAIDRSRISACRERWKTAGFETLALIPLREGGELIGLLHLGDSRREFLSRDDVLFLERLSGSVSVALARGRAESTQRALTASEERYRKLVDLSPDAIYLHRDGKFVFANAAGLALMRAKRPEDLIGTRVIDRVHPDYRERVSQRVRSIQQESAGAPPIEEKLLRLDGSVVDVEAAGAPVALPEGATVLVMARDISERVQARQRLRESEERWTAVVHNEPECVKLLDPEGRLLFMNPAGLSMIQARLEQVEGQRASGLVAEEDRASFDEMVAGVFRGESRHLVFDMIGIEGRRLTLETTSVPLWDAPERNRVATLLGVTRDITERKRAEEALRSAAEDWLSTFDALKSGVLLLDVEDRVMRVNVAAARLLGEERSRLPGRRVAELGQGEPWDAVRHVVAAVRARGTAEIHQVRGEHGRAWDVDGTLAPASEGPGRLVVSVRDVTRLVELQESVKRSEKMAAMGSLVAGVAHEVRNPLFAILANVDALGSVIGHQPEIADLLEAMRKEVDRLRTLMEDLLDYGKTSRSRFIQEGLQACLELALQECAGAAHAAGVDLRCANAPALVLRLDRTRLAQVFENVVTNAIQHSPAGGGVALAFEPFLNDGREWIRCLVLDQGPGFAIPDLPRVFDPFFTRRRGGTGLGLAIAQRIVEEHGGRILVRNREGGGACVAIELPGSASAEPVLAAAP